MTRTHEDQYCWFQSIKHGWVASWLPSALGRMPNQSRRWMRLARSEMNG